MSPLDNAGSIDLHILLRSITTGAESPEEIIRELSRVGIECYVTPTGDLMYRYWQLASQGFVSPEQAGILRTSMRTPERSNPLDWLSENLQDVQRQYAGQWIAIYGNGVVAAAITLPELMPRLAGYDSPFVTYIPSETIVWDFVYGLENF